MVGPHLAPVPRPGAAPTCDLCQEEATGRRVHCDQFRQRGLCEAEPRFLGLWSRTGVWAEAGSGFSLVAGQRSSHLLMRTRRGAGPRGTRGPRDFQAACEREVLWRTLGAGPPPGL